MKRETLFQITTLLALLWLCFFIHSCTAGGVLHTLPSEAEITRPPQVQIGLSEMRRKATVSFSVEGPCQIAGRDYPDGIQASATLSKNGIRLGREEFPGNRLRVHVGQEGSLRVGNRVYFGHLLIVRDQGKLTLVNEVDLERYLTGVVSKEMSLSGTGRMEAFKAQVIAARTYAICETKNGRLRKVNGEKFDLYDDQRSQVYGGIPRESEIADKLVQDTRGMFVTWKKRPEDKANLVNTFYSSTCGGRTGAAWLLLGEGVPIPPLQGTDCGFCENSPVYEWTVKFTQKELAQKLFQDPKLIVESIRVLETLPGESYPGGHVMKVGIQIKGHKDERKLHGNQEFRRRLRMKSCYLVNIEKKKEEFFITGRGWGHGAGMCQYGAYGMSEKGHTSIQILEHYYPGAKVKKLY